ncbi:homocysteine S-methyltransferase [Streptomyces asoensis]|uniref:Homocysteine S-methyltransferase n=1 Tax=Streptomyces asoensis TaxID=249586 RepID=A0ABQ3S988_9ACTN|nr:homocysteine S-methyltransferase [Streptomyces asoensis]GGQ71613.1 homocysteine S-methyltransferase [Streptomyces asoensis]GHI64691.1 homocysteine S-methyltransferase [Streptomyces asoensis]
MTSDTPAPLAGTSLAAALAAGAVVLDGGMSNQLESAGHDLSDELWSARLLAAQPEAVTEAHLAYFEAGADVAITSSYQATFEGFAKRGIGHDEAARLLALSVELARRAARQAHDGGVTRPLWVAASVGPYGAMLADGSEYRGRYGLSVGELERFHRPRLEVLAAAAPDVLALETVPDADEAEAMLRAIRGLGVPAWLSYSVAGDRTRAGQPLDEAFALAAEADDVIAVGVNCCAPEDVEGAVATAARVTGKPVVVYPNSGEAWDAEARAWTGRSSFTTEQVLGWRDAGARLIGGCCRVGPTAITSIAGTLTPA